MRLVFFGTPPIAVPSLERLAGSGHEVMAVITAPDRAKGRGMQTQASAVKAAANDLGLSVMQPITMKDADTVELLRGLRADVFIVVAYGQILPQDVLDLPKSGCVNVHFSLLPRWRGAAPVQWAISEGDRVTGVSIMQMERGLDTGPVFKKVSEPIFDDDTTGSLEGRLAERGAEALVDVLEGFDEVRPVTQDASQVTIASKIAPQDARIDWYSKPAIIERRIRAFQPRPGAWSILNGKRLKVSRAMDAKSPVGSSPGVVLTVAPDLTVAAGGGTVILEEVQPEGRSSMSANEFVRGHRVAPGDTFE